MPPHSALTTLGDKIKAQQLADGLENLTPQPYGVGVFEVEDNSNTWEVGGYFLEPPDEIALLILATAYDAKPFCVSKIPDKNWVSEVKRELTPVKAGRFYVYGSHDAHTIPPNVISLLIEAAMAFGTGHHGTTKGCLMALDNLEKTGFKAQNTLDIGCGTGVLAMAAAHLSTGQIIASDMDEIAVQTAQANIHINHLKDRINVLKCAGFDHREIHSQSPYDLIIANILKGPLIALSHQMAQHCTPNGYVILSGILETQAKDVLDFYKAHNFELVNSYNDNGWTTLTLYKI